VDARLKGEQVEAGQNKIDELDLKLQSLEDQNYQLRVKTHMKKTDYEQYQEILKPYFNGVDVDIESLERMKKEQKQIENRYKDTMIQL
jgi:Tfp pilus assembly protein PilO